MGHKNKGDPECLLKFFQLDLHLFTQFQIERAQRFIQQQHAGFIDQRTRNGNALTLAARKLRRLARNGKAQPDLFQRLLRQCMAFFLSMPLTISP